MKTYKRIYDYRANITITTTPNGDKVLTMNEEILIAMLNHLNDAVAYQKEQGYDATANDTRELWRALVDKEEEEEA